MARGINKVILIGNLGADPDTRMTQQGSAVTSLNVATDESYKDKNTGQMVPKTEWHRVIMFNRLAEIAKDYLRKGSKVYIEGKLHTRKWKDQNNNDRYTTEIIAHELQMLDGAPGNSQSSASQASQQQRPQQQASQAASSSYANNPQNYAQQQQANYDNRNGCPTDDFDDDIPF